MKDVLGLKYERGKEIGSISENQNVGLISGQLLQPLVSVATIPIGDLAGIYED